MARDKLDYTCLPPLHEDMKCEMVVIYYYPEFSAKGIPGLVRTVVAQTVRCLVMGRKAGVQKWLRERPRTQRGPPQRSRRQPHGHAQDDGAPGGRSCF